ncbi:MAG: hypothetical protein EB141_20655, partial [Verrucomicrobia bacterium]|nr:hypothetical protein [Verrucomicrobiota bacterium]
PDVVGEICNAYIDAGADILATNTFNANTSGEFTCSTCSPRETTVW